MFVHYFEEIHVDYIYIHIYIIYEHGNNQNYIQLHKMSQKTSKFD